MINEELMNKAKQAASVEELLELAQASNIELTEEKAKKLFAELHSEGELSDNELDNVTGGGCGGNGGNNENMTASKTVTCNICGRVMPRESLWLYTQNNDGTIICEHCESGQIQGDIASAYARVAERNK